MLPILLLIQASPYPDAVYLLCFRSTGRTKYSLILRKSFYIFSHIKKHIKPMNKENTLYPSVLCAYINCSIKSGRCYYLPVLCCAVLSAIIPHDTFLSTPLPKLIIYRSEKYVTSFFTFLNSDQPQLCSPS